MVDEINKSTVQEF